MSIDFIKSVYYEFLSYFVAKKVNYKIEGNCKKCGKCCQEIHAYGLRNERELKFMQFFLPHYKRFYISKTDKKNNIILSCKYLLDNRLCSVYKNRPNVCKNYPEKYIPFNAEMIEGCGFRVLKKSFKDYL